jgi:hypothetical protein
VQPTQDSHSKVLEVVLKPVLGDGMYIAPSQAGQVEINATGGKVLKFLLKSYLKIFDSATISLRWFRGQF